MSFSYKHYAYITRSGKVIAYGENGHSGGRRFTKSQCTTHAEIDALKCLYKYKQRKRSKLCLYSEAFDGYTYRNSMPCIFCCDAISTWGIRWVVYFDDKTWRCEDVDDIRRKAKFSSGDKR